MLVPITGVLAGTISDIYTNGVALGYEEQIPLTIGISGRTVYSENLTFLNTIVDSNVGLALGLGYNSLPLNVVTNTISAIQEYPSVMLIGLNGYTPVNGPTLTISSSSQSSVPDSTAIEVTFSAYDLEVNTTLSIGIILYLGAGIYTITNTSLTTDSNGNGIASFTTDPLFPGAWSIYSWDTLASSNILNFTVESTGTLSISTSYGANGYTTSPAVFGTPIELTMSGTGYAPNANLTITETSYLNSSLSSTGGIPVTTDNTGAFTLNVNPGPLDLGTWEFDITIDTYTTVSTTIDIVNPPVLTVTSDLGSTASFGSSVSFTVAGSGFLQGGNYSLSVQLEIYHNNNLDSNATVPLQIATDGTGTIDYSLGTIAGGEWNIIATILSTDATYHTDVTCTSSSITISAPPTITVTSDLGSSAPQGSYLSVVIEADGFQANTYTGLQIVTINASTGSRSSTYMYFTTDGSGVGVLRLGLGVEDAGLWEITASIGSVVSNTASVLLFIHDPYISNDSLLVIGNGTSTSLPILDSSPSANIISNMGSVAVAPSVSPFSGVNNNGSLLFPGGAYDYLTISDPTSLAFGTSKFTIEVSAYSTITTLPSNRYPTILSQWSPPNYPFILYINPDSGNKIKFDFDYGAFYIQSTSSYTPNSWMNITVTRNDNTFTLYINGIAEASGTYTGAIPIGSQLPMIGQQYDAIRLSVGALWSWQGYLSNIRVTNGVCRYNGNFAIATADFPTA